MTERFTHYRQDPAMYGGFNPNDVRKILIDPKQRIWIGTFSAGLSRLTIETGNFEALALDTKDTTSRNRADITALHLDKAGQIWVGTRFRGLFQCSETGKVIRQFLNNPEDPAGLSNNPVISLASDKDGRLWIGTFEGLFHLNVSDGTQSRYVSNPDDPRALPGMIISVLRIDRQGRLWIGTDGGGLALYDAEGNDFSSFKCDKFDPRSIGSNKVRDIIEDRDGDLWVVHFPTGVSYANKLDLPFRLVRNNPGNPNSLSDDYTWSFAEDANGDLWIGTDEGGLNCWEKKTGKWHQYRHNPHDPQSLGADAAASVTIDHQGQLWVGTWNGGLNRFDRQTATFKRYLPRNDAPGSISFRNIKHVMEDRRHQLWVATDGGGINRYIPEADLFEQYRQDKNDPDSLNSDLVWFVKEMRDGDLWAGTSDGLAKYDAERNRWRRFVPGSDAHAAVDHLAIYDILESKSGKTWLGTLNGGLFCYDPHSQRLEQLTKDSGLGSNNIRGLLEDDEGFLWISTDNGLTRYDQRQRKFQNFDQSNGLQGLQFVRRACLKLSSGLLIFGGTEGFNIVNPQLVRADAQPPPSVVFTKFEVFNQDVFPGQANSPLRRCITETSHLEIPSAMSVLSFQFTALSYRSHARMQYAYKLEGFDADWRIAGVERRATYTNLNPGSYVLRVRASNSEGDWNEKPTTLELVIVPPFYLTLWFKLLTAAGLLALVALLSRSISLRRMNQRLRDTEHQHQLALQQKLAAEEKTKLEMQLSQSQKMESVGRLAGGVAHDLNNMLVPIFCLTDLAHEDLAPNSPVHESLNQIYKAADRSRNLIRQLLAFARRQTLEMKVLDLNTVVSDFSAMLRRTLRENIAIESKLAPHLPNFKGDAGQIEQIILNLAVNAQDAMPGGGTLFIETALVSLDESFMKTGEHFTPGSYLLMSISDTGTGIAREVLAHVFEPFFTTKEQGQGTGLGLATVYGIARQHNGHVKIYSEEGSGSTFQVYFPALDSLLRPIPSAASSEERFRGNENILLVEDDVSVRMLTSRVLKRAGYSVFEAPAGENALELDGDTLDKMHLVLTDIVLTDMNGKKLYEALHRSRPKLKVLYMSGYSSDVISHNGILEEGTHFIQKPFNVSVLTKMIRNLLDEEVNDDSTP